MLRAGTRKIEVQDGCLTRLASPEPRLYRAPVDWPFYGAHLRPSNYRKVSCRKRERGWGKGEGSTPPPQRN